MDLQQQPGLVAWPEIHFVYLEKLGPFMETAPVAWRTLHQLLPKLAETSTVVKHLAAYRNDVETMIYRAGVAVEAPPSKLPAGLQYSKFGGGKYVCFVLTGSYANLPTACGQAFAQFAAQNFKRRSDFCIEFYANDPKTTPEAKLRTEIMIPTV